MTLVFSRLSTVKSWIKCWSSILTILFALIWIILIRVPLIVNASVHLDSDLAVDGLTLDEVVRGHWRWHYPGTPYTGIGPVLLSYIPSMIWGVGPITLVSGGTGAFVLLVFGVFFLTRRMFGRVASTLALAPLAFSSIGSIWLSGRITGGHLLTVAWSAATWILILSLINRGGSILAGLLGFWSGLGLYLDSMFAMTLIGLMGTALFMAIIQWGQLRTKPGLTKAILIVVVGFGLGFAPRPIGLYLEPHDAYREQFAVAWDTRVLAEHARLLGYECLPRLIAGHRLPGLETDPDPELLGGGLPLVRHTRQSSRQNYWAAAVTILSLLMAIYSFVVLIRTTWEGHSSLASRAVSAGLIITSMAIVGAFILNRNVFNSDNYRYLVLLLIPWSLGFGLAMSQLIQRACCGTWLVAGLLIVFSTLFTVDTLAWYRRLGWLDHRLIPIQGRVIDPVLFWLESHPEVGSIQGGYWDVYRLAFLTGGRVLGFPFAIYPDRFPEWSSRLQSGRADAIVLRPSPEAAHFLHEALNQGGEIRHRGRGFSIITWPKMPPNQ